LFVALVVADQKREKTRPGNREAAVPGDHQPEITPVAGRLKRLGGCLSIPDVRGLVPRAGTFVSEGSTGPGQKVDIQASGFMARVIQHETDHLDGVLFLDR